MQPEQRAQQSSVVPFLALGLDDGRAVYAPAEGCGRGGEDEAEPVPSSTPLPAAGRGQICCRSCDRRGGTGSLRLCAALRSGGEVAHTFLQLTPSAN